MAEERRDGVIWRAKKINRATGRNLPWPANRTTFPRPWSGKLGYVWRRIMEPQGIDAETNIGPNFYTHRRTVS